MTRSRSDSDDPPTTLHKLILHTRSFLSHTPTLSLSTTWLGYPSKMVSLLSFFTGKKKSRRAPSPPPPAGHSANSSAGPSSPNRARTSRFLSLRHKASGRRPPHGVSSRRASSEVARKRSQRKKEAEADLPRLALNWETAQDGQRGRSSLGLEGMGKPPRLERGELAVLDDQQFGWNEVVQGWKCFGKAFRDTGRSERHHPISFTHRLNRPCSSVLTPQVSILRASCYRVKQRSIRTTNISFWPYSASPCRLVSPVASPLSPPTMNPSPQILIRRNPTGQPVSRVASRTPCNQPILPSA